MPSSSPKALPQESSYRKPLGHCYQQEVGPSNLVGLNTPALESTEEPQPARHPQEHIDLVQGLFVAPRWAMPRPSTQVVTHGGGQEIPRGTAVTVWFFICCLLAHSSASLASLLRCIRQEG